MLSHKQHSNKQQRHDQLESRIHAVYRTGAGEILSDRNVFQHVPCPPLVR